MLSGQRIDDIGMVLDRGDDDRFGRAGRRFSGGTLIRGHVEVITTIYSLRTIRVWCDCDRGQDHDFERPADRAQTL
jgi:hypothetical protein